MHLVLAVSVGTVLSLRAVPSDLPAGVPLGLHLPGLLEVPLRLLLGFEPLRLRRNLSATL